jgi:hypothetical protein
MIKLIPLLLFSLLFIFSCSEREIQGIPQSINWEDRVADLSKTDALITGSTYLSTYAEIYRITEKEYRSLAATVSLRNINKTSPVFIHKIEYFNTTGVLVKSFLSKSIYIAPMETLEIVIEQSDIKGGTGANFVFDWSKEPDSKEPFFEAVMVSSTGNQGFAFTTTGQRID